MEFCDVNSRFGVGLHWNEIGIMNIVQMGKDMHLNIPTVMLGWNLGESVADRASEGVFCHHFSGVNGNGNNGSDDSDSDGR